MDRHSDQRESRLPHLYEITPGQWVVTGATLAASGLADVAMHFNGTGVVVGLIATGIAASQSDVILDMIVPGRDAGRTREVTGRVVWAAMPVEEEYVDQSAQAKLSRLFHLKPKDDEIWEKRVQAVQSVRRTPSASEEPDLAEEEEDLYALEEMEEGAFEDLETDEEDLPAPIVAKKGTFLFSEVLSRFPPTLHRIYLASTTDGLMQTCAAKDLCHVALAGNTGGGKSSILRMLMAQLCKAGAQVLLLNPHYTRYDLENEEDWTPFEPYLLYDPMKCKDYKVIEYYLKQAAEVLLPRRLEKRAHSQPVGTPYFIVIDELPAIVRHVKNAPSYMRELLEEGRKVGIFLITAAQDFLIKTISPDAGGGSIRECYRTAYYVGGDGTTARTLLDTEAKKIPEDQLGRGLVMLRCAAVSTLKKAVLARVPLVENAALYRLLGPSTYQPSRVGHDVVADVLLHPDEAPHRSASPARASVTFERDGVQPIPQDRPTPSVPEPAIDTRAAAIANMRAAHFSDKEIMQLVGMNEREYQRVLAQMQPMNREDRSAIGSVSRELPEIERRPNLSVVPPYQGDSRSFHGASTELPENDGNAPVEPAEFTPEAFLPRGDDLLLSELQAELLTVYYRNCGNVNKSLEQIKNDKGQGLGGRYCRHASYLLEQRGLKKRRA